MSNKVTKAAMHRLPVGKFVNFETHKDSKGFEFTVIVWSNYSTGKIEKYDTRTGERRWV